MSILRGISGIVYMRFFVKIDFFQSVNTSYEDFKDCLELSNSVLK
jgi:hypothetical protein